MIMSVFASLRKRFRGFEPPDDGPLEPDATHEEMAGLLSTLRVRLASKQRCSVGLISARAGEGVSTVAHGLATAAAHNPRTKVLLCSVPRDGQARSALGPMPLFVETFAAHPGDRIALGQLGGALLGESVASAQGPAQALVRSLVGAFDLTVVELPPVSEGALGPSLSRALDGVVMVVEAQRTRIPAIRAARQTIERHGGNILGIVLNKRRLHVPEAVYRQL